MHFCVLSSQICGNLVEQPQEINTGTIVSEHNLLGLRTDWLSGGRGRKGEEFIGQSQSLISQRFSSWDINTPLLPLLPQLSAGFCWSVSCFRDNRKAQVGGQRLVKRTQEVVPHEIYYMETVVKQGSDSVGPEQCDQITTWEVAYKEGLKQLLPQSSSQPHVAGKI